MADIADTLKGILGDDAEDKLKSVIGSLSSDEGTHSAPGLGTNGLGDIMQLRNMIEGMAMNRNDPRTNLIMSLRPYMREERQQSIDSAVKLMGVMNIIKMLSK